MILRLLQIIYKIQNFRLITSGFEEKRENKWGLNQVNNVES